MKIVKATALYEEWVKSFITIVVADLEAKHQMMADDEFAFLRATFYRWAQLFPELCPDLQNAPVVNSIGDLHVEQYSTWRDSEARLILGIADFDEAYQLPYTFDLVRLATSACKAIEVGDLGITKTKACQAILQGYIASIACGGKPIVLEEDNPELRAMAIARLAVPSHFWRKLDSQCRSVKTLTERAQMAVESILPKPTPKYQCFQRRAGVGSLGRQRFVITANHNGARIAREAKALLPSACSWAYGEKKPSSHLQEILDASVRSPDPYLKTKGKWVIRRLSPSCSKMELSALPKVRDEAALLWAMGFEAANVHLGTAGVAAKIKKDFAKRSADWLRRAVDVMSDAVRQDYKDWRRSRNLTGA
ncbi:MAG: DUF2252 domain-containing protein [Candidatus Melainabacteria bacterium]|nr:MAG: DUF2252 domain-containing protein [Candidatus Melainabacteria bacterium]